MTPDLYTLVVEPKQKWLFPHHRNGRFPFTSSLPTFDIFSIPRGIAAASGSLLLATAGPNSKGCTQPYVLLCRGC